MISKKGTEKPIEIFVALFVILAVALVMLKLFQSQITEKQKQLSDFEQQNKAIELQQKVQLHCQTKCTEASNNGCSSQSLAALCLAGSSQVLQSDEFLDMNGDKQISYNVDAFGGVGVCEDKVYCFQLMDSCCARDISWKSCQQILDNFWTKKGYSSAQREKLVDTYLSPGSCADEGDDLAWWKDDGYDNLKVGSDE